MKYNFFTDLKNNYTGDIENMSPYQDFFSYIDIVPGDIVIKNISKESIGENMVVSCVTTKGLLLNFFLGTIYIDRSYKDYLCGVSYIYNDKYFYLRNFGYDRNFNPSCNIDFFDTNKLSYLKEKIVNEKEIIEPKDFIKYGLSSDCTFNITLDKYTVEGFELNDDLITLISRTAFDEKTRKRQ